ncbi:MAG: hypothetical protein ABIE42_10730 [Candidatus Eisenbacteria bacterium]
MGKTFFEQVHQLWIEPEICRRREAGKLPDAFQIRRCLILLPPEASPVVLLNDEIGWRAKVKFPEARTTKVGEPISLGDIERIEDVSPPEIDGKRVAFIYVYWTGKGGEYKILFDSTPNMPLELGAMRADGEWQLGKAIADSLQQSLTERVITFQHEHEADLQSIGLWAVPGLIPYPLSKIVEHLSSGDTAAAREFLVKHCDSAYLASRAAQWWDVAEFSGRRLLIEEAIDAHADRKYRLSIYALVPQVEGIITDWIHTNLPPGDSVPYRTESKARKFQDVVLGQLPLSWAQTEIVRSVVRFIVSGPVLAEFQWLGQVDSSFAGRHPLTHGHYDDRMFTEENSLKVLLLLDTIRHIIATGQAPEATGALDAEEAVE